MGSSDVLLTIRGSKGLTAPYTNLVNSISVGTGNSRGQISINGTGNARYHLYNGGAVVEWLFGQDSSTSHDFTFSTLVSTTVTKRATITQDGNLIATPRYGTRGKSVNQLINAGAVAAVSWNDMSTGVLTTNGVTLTNGTSDTLVLYVSYCISWDVSFVGGVVGAYIRNETTLGVYITMNTQLSPTDSIACAASGVIVLPAGQSIACWVTNRSITNLDIYGIGNTALNSCQMSYYVLN